MNNLLYTIAQQRHADLQRTAERERLARAIRKPRRRTGNQRVITRLIGRLARAQRPPSPPNRRQHPNKLRQTTQTHGTAPTCHLRSPTGRSKRRNA
jgi:hypothetical protein